MGTLMLGGTIGFLGMIGLALFGMSGLVPKNRTPALIVALWFIPVLTLIGLVFVVFWPLFSG